MSAARFLTRRALVVVGLAAVVIAAVVVVVVLRGDDGPRGARTPADAVNRFVIALNAADGDAAAGVACPESAQIAHRLARAARDEHAVYVRPGADLSRVYPDGKVVATVFEKAHGRTTVLGFAVLRTSGRWLVCDRLIPG